MIRITHMIPILGSQDPAQISASRTRVGNIFNTDRQKIILNRSTDDAQMALDVMYGIDTFAKLDDTSKKNLTIQTDPNYPLIINGIPISGTAFNHRTVSYTIGAPGVAGCNYNFASVANTTLQAIQLGAADIVPAKSPITSIVAVCEVGLTGASAIVNIGRTSGSDEYMYAVDLDGTNDIESVSQTIKPAIAASSVYVSATPSANWNTTGAWKLKVSVSYNDNSIV